MAAKTVRLPLVDGWDQVMFALVQHQVAALLRLVLAADPAGHSIEIRRADAEAFYRALDLLADGEPPPADELPATLRALAVVAAAARRRPPAAKRRGGRPRKEKA